MGNGKRPIAGLRGLCLALAGMLALASFGFAPVSAQTPAGATAGGALPQLPAESVPLPPPDSMFPIPPSVDRPLDVEEGDRLFVESFALKGVVDKPGLGIDAKQLGELVENLRQETQQLNAVDENGFTEIERVEIGSFMKMVVTDRDLDMRFEDYEALIDKLRAIKDQRDAGMTIGQMQEIAQAVTQYYRSAGFVLAQAFIPAQEVADGVVTIEVLEGQLGNVLAEGNEQYSTDVLTRPFQTLIGAPVEGDAIQSAILSVSDYPGLAVFGVFQPGLDVGTTDLLLRVQEEKGFDASLRADNHGTRFTGARRLFAEGTWNSPTGVGDRLTGSYLRQYRPSNSFFGKLEYERPILPGISMGANFARNPFDVGGELRELDLAGATTQFELYTRGQLVRSLDQNITTSLAFKRTKSISKAASADVNRDDLAYLVAQVDYDSLDRKNRAINSASGGFTVGLGDNFGAHSGAEARQQRLPPNRESSTGQVAANSFTKWFLNYSRLQKLADTHSVLVKLEGQWTPKLLTSTEQFSIGGPANVRAYNSSELLADKALTSTFEYSMAAPGIADVPFTDSKTWGDVLRVSFFMDWAWGGVNEPTSSEESSFTVWGAGTGVSFDMPGLITGRLQYAYPLSDRVPGAPGDPDKGKWWLDFTYQF